MPSENEPQGSDVTGDLFKAYEDLERQKIQEKVQPPAEVPPEAKRLIGYINKCITEATRNFIGEQNSQTVRAELADTVYQVITTALKRLNIRARMPEVDTQPHPKDPHSMIVVFRDPDSGRLLKGTELFRYMGLIK